MKIAIVGCGNMGLAFARSFIKYDLVKREDLLLIEKNTERCTILAQNKEGVVVNVINRDIAKYDLVILAIKPQDFLTMAADLKRISERTADCALYYGWNTYRQNPDMPDT